MRALASPYASTQVGLAWMPILCSIDTHFTSLRAPSVPSALHQELRHDEERDALHAFGRVGRAREHEMHDVLGHVVLAPGDEDLGAVQPVVIAFAARRACAPPTRSEPACGSVRFIVPVHSPAMSLCRNICLLLGRAVQLDRLDHAGGEHRAQAERHVGAVPHLLHRRSRRACGRPCPP